MEEGLDGSTEQKITASPLSQTPVLTKDSPTIGTYIVDIEAAAASQQSSHVLYESLHRGNCTVNCIHGISCGC